MKDIFKLTWPVLLCLSLVGTTGCSQKRKTNDSESEQTINKITTLGAYQLPYDKNISPMRAQMIRDAALSIGARTALAHRSGEINSTVMKYDNGLTRVFNFQGLMLGDNVIPPVLIESDNNLYLANDVTIRVSDRNYELIAQARFTTQAISWRDYLILPYKAPGDPDITLLPNTSGERAIWRKYVRKGWDAGIKQAESIFNENLARMTRDFTGMVKYHNLLSKNMVTQPYVGQMDLGITGSNKQVNINDRILRITALPELQMDSDKWKTVVIQNDRR